LEASATTCSSNVGASTVGHHLVTLSELTTPAGCDDRLVGDDGDTCSDTLTFTAP
jgi:hypothetical protein